MQLLDLFSGIGGFSLAARNAGWRTIGFCEINERCQLILQKNFPGVPIWRDVRTFDGTPFAEFYGVDVISGGFPCTDLSQSAKGSHKGLDGEASGLFWELARIIHEAEPEYIVLENVPQVIKYIEVIQNELPQYDISVSLFDAADFGAACRRKRAFIVGCLGDERSRQILDLAEERGKVVRRRGAQDVLPMLLPWKGGVSLERLASCVVENTQADATRILSSDGLPRGLDGHQYLEFGNAVVPIIPQRIFEAINTLEAQV